MAAAAWARTNEHLFTVRVAEARSGACLRTLWSRSHQTRQDPRLVWSLRIKPDPRILFEAEDWPPDMRDVSWHLRNQELIHGRYRNRTWYPAFRRGISWYQYCRERENRNTPE
jgi:hypothetical protein